MKRQNFILTLFGGMLFAITISLCLPGSASAIDNGRLIDNSVFLDAGRMDQAAIQNFLASKGGGMANYRYTFNCDPNVNGLGSAGAQAYRNAGAPCGQNVPASAFIYYAAQIYGINPQVIMATMQKEQSSITSATLTSWQVDQAMGYGCPDAGGCGASNFAYQIDWGSYTLRLHMERARGNLTWWQQGYGFTCGGPTHYYTPSLYPDRNVTFIDDSGVSYTTVWISNAATSSLYCYTPHAYNNPQGILGNPRYGTVGQYYSGSYNFVLYFERWFGATSYNFRAEHVSQSPYPTLVTDRQTTSFIQYRNVGSLPWYDDVSAPLYKTYPVHLATSNPINQESPFSAGWPTSNRASGAFAKVFLADGVTPAPNQHVAEPGQVVQFNFTLTAGVSPGYYRAFFQPVLEGSTMWDMGGTAWLGVTVQPVTFQASYAGQSDYPTIAKGQSSNAFFKFQNTGNMPWYDDFSAGQLKTYPIHLATTNPINISNPFSANWPTNNRATGMFSKVYEADGTTIAKDQHTVYPGQIAEMSFQFTVPPTQQSGTYRATFQPILEGSIWWNMGGTVWLDVTVQ